MTGRTSSVLSNTARTNRHMSGEADAEGVTVLDRVRKQASAETACTVRTAVYGGFKQNPEKGVVDGRTWTCLSTTCVTTATVVGGAVLRMKTVTGEDVGAR